MPIALRFKLLSIPLIILFVFMLGMPLLGLRHDSDSERIIRTNQEETLLLTTQTVAAAFKDHPDLFTEKIEEQVQEPKELVEPILLQLVSPIRLNADLEDWRPPGVESSELYGENHRILTKAEYQPDDLSFRHLAGTQEQYLYAVFDVYDDQVVYRDRDTLRLDLSDHLKIVIEKDNERQTYIIASFEPGWVTGFFVPDDPQKIGEHERRIHGKWAQTDRGYILEIRIHNQLLGDGLAFAVADVDDHETRVIENLIGTGNFEDQIETDNSPDNTVVIAEILESLDFPRTRIFIVDTSKQVLAVAGESQRSSDGEADPNSTSGSLPSEIATDELTQALEGENRVVHYFDSDSGGEVIAVISPIHAGENVIAMAISEQAVNSLASVSNRSFKEIIFPLVVAFIFSVFGIFLYSYRMSTDE